MRRSKPRLILPPDLPRGETEFEEKRVACEFELAFRAVSEMGLASLKESYEYVFRHGFVTGKNVAKLSQESIGTPIYASVRETAGANKGDEMGLLQVIEDAPGFVKASFQGPQGSGKSRTAVELACTVHKAFGSTKPIAFFDTEGGSDYLRALIEERTGVKPLRVKTRAFSQLMEVTKECREGAADILIVDSITHVWREIQSSYMARINEGRRYAKTRMDIQDIMAIKSQWAPWPDEYLNSSLHIIICGREGNEWGHEEDEESGKRQLVAIGKKMKVEGEFGYEASLMVSMHAEHIAGATIRKKNKTTEKRPSTIINVATILKDRYDIMNGQRIEMPTGDDFMPFIEKLNPELHREVDTKNHSVDSMPESDGGYLKEKTDRQILVEKIQAEIATMYPGQTAADKKARIELMKTFFNTNSWTEIEKRIGAAKLGEGHAKLQAHALERANSAETATAGDPDGKAEAEAVYA